VTDPDLRIAITDGDGQAIAQLAVAVIGPSHIGEGRVDREVRLEWPEHEPEVYPFRAVKPTIKGLHLAWEAFNALIDGRRRALEGDRLPEVGAPDTSAGEAGGLRKPDYGTPE
jgi:hypothetical protein